MSNIVSFLLCLQCLVCFPARIVQYVQVLFSCTWRCVNPGCGDCLNVCNSQASAIVELPATAKGIVGYLVLVCAATSRLLTCCWPSTIWDCSSCKSTCVDIFFGATGVLMANLQATVSRHLCCGTTLWQCSPAHRASSV